MVVVVDMYHGHSQPSSCTFQIQNENRLVSFEKPILLLIIVIVLLIILNSSD